MSSEKSNITQKVSVNLTLEPLSLETRGGNGGIWKHPQVKSNNENVKENKQNFKDILKHSRRKNTILQTLAHCV